MDARQYIDVTVTRNHAINLVKESLDETKHVGFTSLNLTSADGFRLKTSVVSRRIRIVGVADYVTVRFDRASGVFLLSLRSHSL